MKNYEVKLMLKPTGRYIGVRYIKIEMSAEDIVTAGKFAVETISVLLTEDVEVTIRSVKTIN